jgi:hypothetical protein
MISYGRLKSPAIDKATPKQHNSVVYLVKSIAGDFNRP